MQPQIHST